MRTLYLNSFYMFSFSFIFAITLYYLGLSDLYKNLNYSGAEFSVFAMVVLGLIIGFFYRIKLCKYFKISNPENSSKSNVFIVSTFIIMGSILEVFASGGVPLLYVISGSAYQYKDFGIASFHVFLLSYISASAIIGFERYVIFGGKRNLFLTVLGVLFTIVIVNRAAMLMILIPCFLLYLTSNNKLKPKIIILSLFLCVVVSFGYIGDSRMKSSGYSDDAPIFRLTKIDNPVMKSLPSGFTWFYVYISSPYANLLNQEYNNKRGHGEIKDFINIAILPDFISKRIDDNVRGKFPVLLITDELTAATGFSWGVSAYGTIAIVLIFLYMSILIFFFSYINRRRYIRSIAAILSTASALMIFDNMFVFAACVMQLVIISLFCGRKVVINGKQVNML
ncbi:oligosaccharide repeat unit polymerase [Rahnella aceris]|uniref:O-antigen polymerase n=1 Tax=Rahnella sp. (strain Y9602) TaxID=2703885 RepID=UPI00190598F0|nr:O-antigen polymerase [Rahnella aceris]QQN33233.1 oligosaccharide repeat unit polymerase [Rahnella aceris]